MNTTAAALQAHVTADTIRTWCRRGAVAAVKQAGRWIIDAASLAHRIAIGAMRRRKERTVEYTLDTMTAIGGNEWTSRDGSKHRVYINDWTRFLPLEIDRYKSGNISYATWDGEKISNAQAGKILGSIDKVWFDTADGKLHARFGFSESRVASRDEIWQSIVTGIQAAIAAL